MTAATVVYFVPDPSFEAELKAKRVSPKTAHYNNSSAARTLTAYVLILPTHFFLFTTGSLYDTSKPSKRRWGSAVDHAACFEGQPRLARPFWTNYAHHSEFTRSHLSQSADKLTLMVNESGRRQALVVFGFKSKVVRDV